MVADVRHIQGKIFSECVLYGKVPGNHSIWFEPVLRGYRRIQVARCRLGGAQSGKPVPASESQAVYAVRSERDDGPFARPINLRTRRASRQSQGAEKIVARLR